MQTIPQNSSSAGDLQQSLDAFFKNRLDFDALRTQWIITLADNPELCAGAVRLLYKQSVGRKLSEERTLSLKRIVEAAVDDGPEDWTATFDDEGETPSDVVTRPTITLAPGQVLKNRFVLEEELGGGGVGIVFRAHDRLLQRAEAGPARIAIKVLREEFRTNPELLHVLRREAGHAQGLSHPNIVRIYDLHQHGETYFITMELLEGQSLKALLSKLPQEPLRQDRAIRIILGMCRGLAFAHERGLVHADFKPGNVILTPGDEPKILDFGLSQVAASFKQAGGGAAAGNEQLRAITPAYASCNRLEGRAPTFSDDVYSLSCVIYELISGRHPYDRKSALAARALNLAPERIDELTDLEWRTLANGLRLSRDERSTQVHDLQVAFSPVVALQQVRAAKKRASTEARAKQPSPNKSAPVRSANASKNTPARIRRERRRSGKPSAMRWLLPAAAVVAAAVFVSQPIGQKYLDRVGESKPVQSLRSTILGRFTESESSVNGAVLESTSSIPGTEVIPIDESASLRNRALPESTTNNPGTKVNPVDESAALGNSTLPESRLDAEPVAPSSQAALRASTDAAPAEQPASIVVSLASNDAEGDAAAIPAAAVTPGFQFDAAEYFVREGDAALVVKISRQGDVSSEASVEWMTVAASARPQLDYVGGDRNRAFFAAGESTSTIFIPIISDATREPEESFRIALSRPDGNRVLVHPFTATVTIIDDDG